LTPWLLRLEGAQPLPETHLFLKDALPENYRDAREFHVFLDDDARPPVLDAPEVLVDVLPVLQQHNPLAWVGLVGAFARRLTQESSVVESLWLEHFNGHKK